MKNKVIFVSLLMLMNYTSIFSFKWVPSWSNPLKFGYKVSFKKSDFSFSAYILELKKKLAARKTSVHQTSSMTIETVTASSIDYNKVVEQNINLFKITYYFDSYFMLLWKNLAQTFKKSHFEGI